MSKLRNPVIPDYTPKKKEQPEVKLDLKPCLVCKKTITDGYYGAWGDGGVCSKACNNVQSQKPRYPGHTEEDFLQRMSEEESDS